MKFANEMNIGGKLFVSANKSLFVCAAIVFGFAGATPASAQSQSQTQRAMDMASAASSAHSAPTTASTTTPLKTYEYEVASIKPSKTDSANGVFRFAMRYTDDGLSVENFPLMLLVQQAYGVGKDRISGAPDWLNAERFDIEAKMDGAAADELKKLSPEDLRNTRRLMLQALLADRFKLTLHQETKELPVYNLVIAKGGPKLQESKPDEATNKGDKAKDGAPDGKRTGVSPSGPTSVGVGIGLAGGGSAAGGKNIAVGPGGGASVSFGGRGGNRTMSGRAVTMEGLTGTLSNVTGRPVVDKTGLSGKYDYRLEYAPEDNSVDADPTGPSIFTAVQEQLGLKLESAKGPVGIFVIDHVERPSGN
jgi:uncharacterized protein (TIGR03435 family)